MELCSKNVLFMEEIEVPLALGVKESYERFLKAIGRKRWTNAMMRAADASLKKKKERR